MGTTQRIVPGVPGQPNWGDLNKSLTNISKNIQKEEDQNSDETLTPEQRSTEYRNLITSRNNLLKSVFKNLVKTGGGVKTISSGGSSSIGNAGLKSTQKIARLFSDVESRGLVKTLEDIGFGSLEGKSIQDVINYLLVYCSDTNTGLDETAANKASCEVLNEIAAQTDNDLNEFERLIKEYVKGNRLTDILCQFWGLYIFEHLSQRFQEKITQKMGEPISTKTFRIIKEDIIGQVKVLNENRPMIKIAWRDTEGAKIIESIFESIIKILGNEDND